MEVYGVIYLIWNMVNGKKYVGQTTKTVGERFYAHSYADSVIGRAIRKYGRENFRYGVIKSCISSEELNYWEKFFVSALKAKTPYGYNMTDGGEYVFAMTNETRKKISVAQLGEKHHFFGKHHTDEHRAKMSKKFKGKKRPPEVGRKISATKKGKHFSAIHCIKMSVARRGNSPFKNLLAEIDARQFSYRILAELMSVSSTNVARKMRGERKFNADEIKKLEEIFGKPAEYLLQRDDE